MTNNVETYYAPFFKGWSVKQLGEKPTAEMLTTAGYFGRPGKQTLALAMAMRPEGVTAAQIIMACGAPQNNHRTAEITAGHFKREPHAPDAKGHTVYKVTLTAKGTKRAETIAKRLAEAEANAAAGEKPKAKAAKGGTRRKPRQPKAVQPAVTNEPGNGLEGDQPVPSTGNISGDMPQATA
jgi:hypothetical protein